MKIRSALDRDLTRIVEIYNSTICTRQSTADTEPVTVDERKPWFDRHSLAFRPLYVAQVDNTVVGWISFESFYGRPAYKSTVELSVYVSADYRCQGVARQLLKQAINVSPDLNISNLIAYIFSHNTPSIMLFKQFEFKLWGELPNIAVMDGQEYSLSIYGRRV